MACSGCGKRRPAPSNMTVVQTGSQPVSLRAEPTLALADVAQPLYSDDKTMVELEYLGPNVGTETWYGPTGRRYRFGRNHKHIRTMVYLEDVETLLEARMFRVVPKPVQPQPAPVTPKADDPQLELAETESLTVKMDLDNAPDMPLPVLYPEQHNVSELLKLELTPEQWRTLAANEQRGKARVTVLNYAAKQV